MRTALCSDRETVEFTAIPDRAPQLHHWEIRTNLGRRARPGCDGTGWLWEISRDDEVARVMIEISEASWSTDAVDLPEDTRRALETDGRTELLKVLAHDDPPRVIRCGSTGCTYRSPPRTRDLRGLVPHFPGNTPVDGGPGT
jgi:hypothetical protein